LNLYSTEVTVWKKQDISLYDDKTFN
jgi:hypothetical protein